MKRTLNFVFAVLISVLANYAFGQKTNAPSISVGPEVGIPIGSLADSWNVGVGGKVKAAVPLTQGLDATLTSGLTSFSGKNFSGYKIPSMNMVPILLGVQTLIARSLLFAPQLGVMQGFHAGSSSTYFAYVAALYYLISNNVNLSLFYQGNSARGLNLNYVGILLAYQLLLRR
jgi:hypothetical protein